MANFRGLVGGGVGVGLSYGLFGVIHDTFGRLHESVVHPAIATCETPVVPAVKALHPVFGASLGHLTEHSSKVVMFGVAALAAAYTGYVTWKALRWLRSWKLSDLLPVGRGRVQSVISNLADGIFQMDRKVSTLEEAVGVLHNAADSGIASVQTEVNVLHTKMKRVNRTVDRVEETVSRVEEQANSAQQGVDMLCSVFYEVLQGVLPPESLATLHDRNIMEFKLPRDCGLASVLATRRLMDGQMDPIACSKQLLDEEEKGALSSRMHAALSMLAVR
jgi:hypothetical protein|uniref:DUF1664 domain-containing protein n=1 Tax=Eutreptiella gymnastica TaxID=73025 RepID=A0A7S4FGF7_9EUGL|mmetsp:Transcript_73009/g.123013  ORF Transcript_73009/g.123013 Transcript_73009/m.123013 type:complete len:276 (+) Transcript_73009:30-857(+)|eukprot:CAMPEP_0174301706 /NCGR_PEP_ID=MMETSP0809-20121228/59200_1 /TAXON_ID=73025 ORGANISM="Eutreptiella gymnastica-like, Strain CCMP1594" /NCGR_SAMPLE_ID=MMETSP0809 /ASSEMBLY_ACC=CAM_ASM_000658 /LENGTH=275 /DNA_ID=CAMNT_0015407495 /DNA_START=29 /DNA_END=856 /DNA_ORIENTATION=+